MRAKMLVEQPALQEFGERGLCELVGVQIGHLLYQTQALNRSGWATIQPTRSPGNATFAKLSM